MKEKIDTNSSEFWEKKLAESGLPSNEEVDAREEVPLEVASPFMADEGKTELDNEVETILASYEGLDPKLQQDIIEDIKKLRAKKCTFQEILDRLDVLGEFGYKMMELTTDDSDKEYKPKNPKSEQEGEDDQNEKMIDELLKKMEEMTEVKKQPQSKDTIH